jgi:hypothetical protein
MNVMKIFGPGYVYRGEVLTEPTVLWIIDHHFDADTKHYPIKQLLDNSTCDPGSHLIVFDDFLSCQDFESYQHVCFPGRTALQVEQFMLAVNAVKWDNKQKTFNFIANKVRPSRLILSRLVNYFNLSNFVYSQSWPKHSHWIQEKDISSSLDRTVVDAIFHCEQQDQSVYLTPDQSLTSDNYIEFNGTLNSNGKVYENLLKQSIYEPSFVSLITEPLYDEHETMITEKTVMAIYGGTVPIWVGGYLIADHMRTLGFDVFDDLIDHSYQQESMPFDRCYQAINKNLSVLTDLDRLQDFFCKNRQRFENNFDLLTKHKILSRICREKIEAFALHEINSRIENLVERIMAIQ